MSRRLKASRPIRAALFTPASPRLGHARPGVGEWRVSSCNDIPHVAFYKSNHSSAAFDSVWDTSSWISKDHSSNITRFRSCSSKETGRIKLKSLQSYPK
ncbi:hypothetical protein GN956_G6086 [Arapaima gigas]